MRLYFARGSCSLAPHIALREAALPFELESVHLGSKLTKSGRRFREINPKGYVPALDIGQGRVLTEVAVILQWIAAEAPEAGLAPSDRFEHFQMLEWLNFIATELHKQYSPIFGAQTADEWKEVLREKIRARLDHVGPVLSEHPYLLGERYSIADPYLFTILRWSKAVGIALDRWPSIESFVARVSIRPAVKAALEAEGLKA